MTGTEGDAVKLQRHGIIGRHRADRDARARRVRLGQQRPRRAASSVQPAATRSTAPPGTLNAQGSTAQKNAMDEWIKAYQQTVRGRADQLPGHRFRRRHPGVHRRHRRLRRLRLGAQGRRRADQGRRPLRRRPGHRPADGGRARSPSSTTSTGVTDLQLKPATLAKIFAGKITKWDDAAIKADNPDANAALDHDPQRCTGRTRSGTTDNFTKYLDGYGGDATGPSATTRPGRPRAAQAEKGTDGVASRGQAHRRRHRLRRVVVRPGQQL